MFITAIANTTVAGQNLLDSVNLTPSAWDYILGVLLVVASFFYALSLGKNRLMVINLGAFISYVLTKAIPWNSISFLAKNKPSLSFEIFIFLAVILAIFFLLPKSSLTSAVRIRKRGNAVWWQLMLFGVGQVGMLAAMIGSFLYKKSISAINPLMKSYFFNELWLFIWLIFNVLLMLFLKKRKEEE